MKLDFHKIQLEDKKIYEKYSEANKDFFGWEYSFAMTWVWNAFEETKVCDIGDMAFVWTRFFGQCVYFPPMLMDQSQLPKAVEIIAAQCCECGCTMDLRGLTKEQAESLDEQKYVITSDRGSSDYLYSGSSLANLTGKKYHSKRNFVSRFKNKYDYIFREYNEVTDREQIFELYKKWNTRSTHETLDLEEKVIARAFDSYKQLGLDISVIEIDNKIAAFSVNSVESDKIAHTFFEKGDTEYEGIYQAINQFNAQKFLSDVEFVNRQEDMGIEGLRKAKLSYNPVSLWDKYSVKIRK